MVFAEIASVPELTASAAARVTIEITSPRIPSDADKDLAGERRFRQMRRLAQWQYGLQCPQQLLVLFAGSPLWKRHWLKAVGELVITLNRMQRLAGTATAINGI